mmetsp:Transcript_17572/g.66869  ORF Transcript_17572/g.66869 Transcript_17572/m.66869 type:complete len:273 (-) Transcript_17572:535-1353(-)
MIEDVGEVCPLLSASCRLVSSSTSCARDRMSLASGALSRQRIDPEGCLTSRYGRFVCAKLCPAGSLGITSPEWTTRRYRLPSKLAILLQKSSPPTRGWPNVAAPIKSGGLFGRPAASFAASKASLPFPVVLPPALPWTPFALRSAATSSSPCNASSPSCGPSASALGPSLDLRARRDQEWNSSAASRASAPPREWPVKTTLQSGPGNSSAMLRRLASMDLMLSSNPPCQPLLVTRKSKLEIQSCGVWLPRNATTRRRFSVHVHTSNVLPPSP